MLHSGIIKNLNNIDNYIRKRFDFSIIEGLQKSNFCFNNVIYNKNNLIIESNLEKMITNSESLNCSKYNKTVKIIKKHKKNNYKTNTNDLMIKTTKNLFKSDYIKEIDNIDRLDYFDDYQNYKIIYEKDKLLLGFCCIVYNDFILLGDKQKKKFLDNLKYKMTIDLNKENLYDKLNYKKKRINKTKLETSILNSNYDENFFRYLADYFDVNLIVIENNKYIHYKNDYLNKRHTVLISILKNDYIIQINTKSHSLLNNPNLKFYYIKNSLNTLKLCDLQDLALNLGINVKKQGKKGLINKKKIELINDIEKK